MTHHPDIDRLVVVHDADFSRLGGRPSVCRFRLGEIGKRLRGLPGGIFQKTVDDGRRVDRCGRRAAAGFGEAALRRLNPLR
ncbi:MAG: hypothetical protein HY655_06095 [Acidobacteria bacterium]|nr:hypothetical protein [Acidobacteriota bacterium]